MDVGLHFGVSLTSPVTSFNLLTLGGLVSKTGMEAARQDSLQGEDGAWSWSGQRGTHGGWGRRRERQGDGRETANGTEDEQRPHLQDIGVDSCCLQVNPTPPRLQVAAGAA